MIRFNHIHAADDLTTGFSTASAENESGSFSSIFSDLARRLPTGLATIVTTMPRGGLQIVQPERVSEDMLRAHTRDLHKYDRLTWGALLRQQPVTDADVWNDKSQPDPFLDGYLKPSQFEHAIAIPLEAPVLPGYPGALHVYRTAAQGAFSDAEKYELTQIALEVDRVAASRRQSRETNSLPEWEPKPVCKVFIFDQSLNQLLTQCDSDPLDSQLRERLTQVASSALRGETVEGSSGDRISIADSRDDLWHFKLVKYDQYPAISDGPVVFLCLTPSCQEWGLLHPSDVQADPELARMVPALQFMHQEFRTVPTLADIAKTVHLSPFHFHRRFTELLGLTPKHFLLGCQIAEAKRELVSGEHELSKIASDCGFAHQSHFTSRFKQATGLTPTRWRRTAAVPETTPVSSN